jgi:hypothetical protein
MNTESRDLLRKIFQYLIEGFAISLVFVLIFKQPKYQNFEFIILLGLTASAVFAILDMLAPVIAKFIRQGTGFSLGMNLTGNLMNPIPAVPLLLA